MPYLGWRVGSAGGILTDTGQFNSEIFTGREVKGKVLKTKFYFKIPLTADLSSTPRIHSIFSSYTIGVTTLHSPRASVVRRQEEKA